MNSMSLAISGRTFGTPRQWEQQHGVERTVMVSCCSEAQMWPRGSLLMRLTGSNVSPALLSSYLTMLSEVKRFLWREDVCCRRCGDLFLPLLQIIFGTKQLTLVGRKERAILAKTCSDTLIAEVCENEIFLIGGYNKKNLNVVGVPRSL